MTHARLGHGFIESVFVLLLVLTTGCDGVDGGAAQADAASAHDAGDDRLRFQAPHSPVSFKGVPLWTSTECSQPGGGRGASIVVVSSSRVLVAGCDLMQVDSATGRVTTLEREVGSVDMDGDTVAVLGSKGLGLSLDGGKSFEWTTWQLNRCQGWPLLAAGEGYAVVACVAGIGVWRGKGTSFAPLSSIDQTPLDPQMATAGRHLVIRTFKGLFDSLDAGETFKELSVSGSLDVQHASWLAIAGSELLAADNGLLHAAQVGTGAFAERAALSWSSFTFDEAVLVASNADGSALSVSTDAGQSFVEVTASDASLRLGRDAVYGDGHLYSVNEGTLLIGKVSE